MKLIAALFMFAIWILSILIGIGVFAVTIHGLYLAFSASILLGILALILEPSPLVFSLFYLLANTNLPQKIVAAFPQIFQF